MSSELSGEQIKFLSTEYLVLLTPSVIGSFSVLVVSIVRWRHLNEQVHLLVQLALADLLAAVILMYSSAMNDSISANSVKVCQYILPLSLQGCQTRAMEGREAADFLSNQKLHQLISLISPCSLLEGETFYFISFLLVVVYAWKSKSATQGWRVRPTEDECEQNGCRRAVVTLRVYITMWLIPIALYLAYVGTLSIKASSLLPASDRSLNMLVSNNSEDCTSCILFLHFWKDHCSGADEAHDIFIRCMLFMTVILVLVSCSVIYYKVGKWYESHHQEGFFPVEGDGRSRRRFKKVFATARNMILVIFFCWAPVLFLILLSSPMLWKNIDQRSLFGFYVIQAAGVSLQGFLNSVVYAWRRPNFREAVLGENTPLVAYNRQAFFDESLRSLF